MKTCFFSPVDILNYFKKGELKEEFQAFSAMGIASVADILHLTEDWKKGNLSIHSSEIMSKFRGIMSEESVYITELDRDRLSVALFKKDENNVVTGLCQESAKETISPKRSLRLLSLKISDETSWWSETVLEEMDEYHNELDRDG